MFFKSKTNDRRYFKRRSGDRKNKFLGWATRFFALIGLSISASLILMGISLSGLQHKVEPLPDNIVLFHHFDHAVLETQPDPSLTTGFATGNLPTVRNLIRALDEGAKDPRVSGFIARLHGVQMNLSHIQELDAAIARFRESGRFAYVFGEEYGGMGGNMVPYRFATAFDSIWLQPVGNVSISGLAAETPFVRDLLDKLGIKAQMFRRGAYKSMPESGTENQMTEPHREMMEWVVGDLYDQLAGSIATNRDIDRATLDNLVTQSPFNADAALEAKLVDRVDYIDKLVEEARARAGGEAETISLMDYFARSGSGEKQGLGAQISQQQQKSDDTPQIALIYGNGAVMPGDDSQSTSAEFYTFLGGPVMSARKIFGAFDQAIKNDNVKAIVFRVNSPGGSPSASESILHAIDRAREKGIPVIVSMGPLAASGGYWISAPATRIVASPATLTGSIGVFAGKVDISGLNEKLGINWETIARGKYAAMWSANRPFSADESAVLNRLLDDVYDDFLTRVAKGRKMSKQDVHKIAEGRVWTGRQARDIGLVDELGGLDTALDLARAEAGIAPDGDFRVQQYPRPLTALEQFMKIMREGLNAGDPMGAFMGHGAATPGQSILRGTLRPLAPYLIKPMDAAVMAPVTPVQ